MLRVFDCIAHEHDARLLVLAVLIALFGSHTTIRLLRHVGALPPKVRRFWLATSALAAGLAIWATHFVAMLAFRPGVPISYDSWLTGTSLVVGVLVTGAGIGLALRSSGWKLRAAGGALVGLGIAVMHYLGMWAVDFHGYLSWNTPLVAASVLAGCGLAAAAMVVAFVRSCPWRGPAAAGLFALAICATHFIGIAAATVHLTNRPIVAPDAISPSWLALNVAFVCGVILLLSLAALDLDRRAARQHEQERASLRSLADIAVEGLAVCDGDRVVAVNTSLEQMVGCPPGALQGIRVDALFAHAKPAAAGMTLLLEKAGERILSSAGGEPVPVEVVRKPILFGGRPHEVVALRDLRERRKAEAEIRFLAHHDPLTGMSNRAAFGDALDRRLSEPTGEPTVFALLALDLDRFKAVNDTLGHPFGDALLKRVGERIRAAVRDVDISARMGGDEFCILLDGPMLAENAAALAQRVVEMIRRPFIIDGEVVSIGASVGIALAPQDGANAVALMKSADLALYRAKTVGGGGVCFFEPGLAALVHQRRCIEKDLRRALSRNELVVHYQPLLDIRSQSVRGFEALVRWQHPERGLLLPGEFIAVAEETRLIVPIGARVLQLAAAQAAAWGGDLSVAVNLSAVQFADGNLVDTVRAVLARTGLQPHRLELEITETVLLRDGAATLAILHELRGLGLRISMDDFGTGYSSLRYLRSFPFDKIKIDRSFVDEMLSNEECAAIIDAVIGIGRRLGIGTTAEGVETEAQLRRLREEGCDMIQGYLIGRPEPAEDAIRHLINRHREMHADVR
jgi:diguanylate cyclase (GGDEF)-like protein